MKTMLSTLTGREDLPLATRIKRGAFAITMLAVMLLGSLSLALTLYELPASQQKTNQTAAEVIATALTADLENRLAEIGQLSGNTLVASALDDPAGRDSHLRPFLQDRQKYAGRQPLQLRDRQGQAVIGELPATVNEATVMALVERVFANGRPATGVVDAGSKPLLLAVHPVYSPAGTGINGALVGTVAVADAFQRRSAGLADGLAVTLNERGSTLLVHPPAQFAGHYPVSRTLALTGTDGALTLGLHSIDNPWLQPLLQRIGLFLLLGAVLGARVWQLSGQLAHRVTHRLDALAEACSAVSAGKRWPLPEDTAADEIGVLSRTLHDAIDAYEEVNARLEDRIADKTRQLSESEARFRGLFEKNAAVMLLVAPATGTVVEANEAAAGFYGCPLDQLVGSALGDIDAAGPAGVGAVLALIALEGRKRHLARHRLKNGQLREVEIDSTLIPTAPEPLVVAIVRDVTERRRAEQRLRLAASVFSQSHEAIMITRTSGEIIDVNAAFCRITGYARDEALGRNADFLDSGNHDAAFHEAQRRELRDKGRWQGEMWSRRRNGEIFPEHRTISAVLDERGQLRHYVTMFADMTELKEHERQLERITYYDPLTTLPNRVLLIDRLQQAMGQVRRRSAKLAVLYLDLDGFRAINDQHGQEAGNHLLTTVAGRMKQALREGDTLARVGGDEFVVVMLDIAGVGDCLPVLNRLLLAAAQPLTRDGEKLQVSASIGVTLYPQAEEQGADQLLRQADQAMYQAKRTGKNRYHVFDPDQDRSVRIQYESQESIRHALAQEQFVLYYQPKVNMRSGEVLGVEALIRWQHPERGLLPPAVFLPVVDSDRELAIELGEWVIDTALERVERWAAAGLVLPVSVNVGAHQLQQPDFVSRLRELLAAHPRLPPRSLVLEVLETSALEDLAHASRVIADCRDIGVDFALDDFGTGYSSLAYLKKLPGAELKIDQSFVRDMLDDPDDLAILDGVLGLAGAFRRDVIAEGVESVAHGAMLLQLGCERAQGYGIARPMPEDELTAWVQSWRPAAEWQNVPPIQRADLPILHLGVEHRAWIATVAAYVRGERALPPALEEHQCAFGKWLDLTRRERPELHDALADIDDLHHRVHQAARHLCSIRSNGRIVARDQLDELEVLRDRLIAALHEIAATPAGAEAVLI